MTLTLTREQALDELIKVEAQLRDLQSRRKMLRAIVLAQTYEYSAANKTHANGGPRAAYTARNSASLPVLTALQAAAKPLTARQIRMTIGQGYGDNACVLTLGRLLKRGLVNCDKTHSPHLWSLAVHRDAAEPTP
jgi:hypothetical protein